MDVAGFLIISLAVWEYEFVLVFHPIGESRRIL